MATIHTEDASDRLHLSLLSSPKDHDNPNTGVYSYREEAQGQGSWIVTINTGCNWQQFPEVSQSLDLGALKARADGPLAVSRALDGGVGGGGCALTLRAWTGH